MHHFVGRRALEQQQLLMPLGLSREELLDDVGLSSSLQEVDLLAQASYDTTERISWKLSKVSPRDFVKCVASDLGGTARGKK